MREQNTETFQGQRFVSTRPYVSFKGMQQSAIVLYDLVAYYLPLYGLSDRDFFTCYPVLGFVEALIYQVAEEVETGQLGPLVWRSAWHEKKQLILELLDDFKIHHPQIKLYLAEIEVYLELIQKLIHHGPITHSDLMRVAELRAADFGLLHTIMICMLDLTRDDQLFDLLRAGETWGDLLGDIQEYANDVAAGRYNTYHMFVKLYGEKAPPYFQVEVARYQTLYEEQLARLPEEEQAIHIEINERYEQDYPPVPIPEPILENV